MFNLNEIIQAAQGGQAIDNIAEQFGLPPGQAQQAVQALLPAISAGLKNRSSDAAGLGGVLGHVADPQHQAAFQSAEAAQSDEAQMAGTQALNHIVGGQGVVSAIAQKAANATGVSPELLEQMMPQVASIALGGVMTAMQNRGFGGLVGQLSGMANSGGLATASGQAAAAPESQDSPAAQQSGLGGLLGGLVGGFLGGRSPQTAVGGQSQPNPTTAASGLSTLAQLFEHGASTSPQLEQEFSRLIGNA